MMKNKIVRNLATEENKKFWASAEKIAAQADGWPASRRAGINVSDFRQMKTEARVPQTGSGDGGNEGT